MVRTGGRQTVRKLSSTGVRARVRVIGLEPSGRHTVRNMSSTGVRARVRVIRLEPVAVRP